MAEFNLELSDFQAVSAEGNLYRLFAHVFWFLKQYFVRPEE